MWMAFILLAVLVFQLSWVDKRSFADGEDPRGRFYYEQRGDIVWEVPTKQRVIALTFDDGPNSQVTPVVLELLKQYHAHATFFCMGKKVDRYGKLAKQIVAEGNEVGNHTYDHPNLRRVTLDQLRKEIEDTNKAIFKATGIQPTLFRPPGGVYNEMVVKAAKEFNQQTMMWSWDQDTLDWKRPPVPKIVRKVVRNASNGDIVLFHDSQMNTVRALKEILPELQKQGYQFVTVSQLLKYKKKV